VAAGAEIPSGVNERGTPPPKIEVGTLFAHSQNIFAFSNRFRRLLWSKRTFDEADEFDEDVQEANRV
jgi:hypothetical protein